MTKLEGVTVVRDGTELDAYFTRYADSNRTAIQLVERASGEPYSRLTVNMPEVQLGPDEILVKDYSECEGNLAAAEDAGLVATTGRFVEHGYVKIPICRLLKKPEGF